MSSPLAYFITFHTYGSWLHGRTAGSVDWRHNIYGTPVLPPDPQREDVARERQVTDAVTLAEPMRFLTDQTLREVCLYRDWTLHALHVRTNHVHAVVTAQATPEKVMSDFKAYATRKLRQAGSVPPRGKVWSEHGSTRYLWTEEQVCEPLNSVEVLSPSL